MKLFKWFRDNNEDIGNFSELLAINTPVEYMRLNRYVNKVNESGGTYHKLYITDEIVIHGEYDMTKYIKYYNLPQNLKGKAVLDIGTSSGFFALECARRGGKVTAIDIWDDPLLNHLLEFMSADIRYIKKSIYDIDMEFGQFDLVICGSLLLHLPEPFEAIRRIRSVCRGKAIVSTASTSDSMTSHRPLCEFVGIKASDGDYWTYWSIGAAALKKMFMAAGFSGVEKVDHFTLKSEPGRMDYATPHVVMTGII
jgi:tRNA (mo5U34)-methyltransferase